NNWRLRVDQWYSLLLHVRASQTAVNTVFLDEWNQSGSSTKDFFFGSIHHGDFAGVNFTWLQVDTGAHASVLELTFFGQFVTRFSNNVFSFLNSVHIYVFVSDFAFNYLQVRGFQEAIVVHAGVTSHV